MLSRRPRALLVAALALLALASAACANGSYPVDLFYEMHYHQSFGYSEPPRLSPPVGAIPITGVEAPGSENPIAGQSIQEGSALFAVNCVMCHGPLGKGDGPVLQTMMQDYGYVPLETLSIDLSSADPRTCTENLGPGGVRLDQQRRCGHAPVLQAAQRRGAVESRKLR